MFDTSELSRLLLDPLESPTIEYKGWLDLDNDPEHKGLLAKAVIALANEGGGYIVLGFSDDLPQLVAVERPAELAPYDQDEINGIVKRFAEPQFHCSLTNVTHPVTGASHPVVTVPGGHGVPVMSKSGSAKSIAPHLCYVRKPGPASAPATTQADWSRLLDRCIRNRQSDMLDAIRAIVQGRVDAADPPSASARLLQEGFVTKARSRWHELTRTLPSDDTARCPLGRYEIDFAFEAGGPFRLPALLEHMHDASRIAHTGWAPFSMPRSPEIAPKAVDGTVECWLGKPELPGISVEAAYADFWRLSPEVRGFLLRGYKEDGIASVVPGTVFDASLPVWRLGEIILYAARLAASLQATGQLHIGCRWSGLSGRSLTFISDWSRSTGGDHRAAQDAVESTAVVPLGRIGENLPEIVRPLLQPLYEAFSFFDLPEWLVIRELTAMRKGHPQR